MQGDSFVVRVRSAAVRCGKPPPRDFGEQFEDREHELLGEHGLEGAVAEVFNIEAALQVDDLAQFTP